MNISEFQYDNVENDAGRIYIRYKIEDSKKALDIYRKGKNETYIKKIKEALAKAGFELQIKNGYLTLFLDVGDNLVKSSRMAGRHKKQTGVKFSDVVLMQQSMTSKEIAEKLGLSSSSYTRHNRKMKQSGYYSQLDKSRLNDKEYLESVRINLEF